MSYDFPAPPPNFFRTREAAIFLCLSPRTLERHRTFGTGPTYHKLGGRVVYAYEDLMAWSQLGAVSSTSDPRGVLASPRRRGAGPARSAR